MLQVQRHPQYVQRVFSPAVSPHPAAGAWLACLGRLRGTGSFDLEQVPRQPALHVVQSGAGWLTTSRGRAESLSPGDVFIILPGERARYREDPQRSWRYTWLAVHGPTAIALLEGVGFTGNVRVLRGVATSGLWRLCDEAEAAYTARTCSPFTPAVLALRLAEALAPAGCPASPADAAAALRLSIDSGYAGDLTVAGAADRLGVDRSTLFRRFRAAYGCGPRAYLHRVRLERARDLLLRGAGTVTAIAATCGYADHRAFARAYRQRYQENPSTTMAPAHSSREE